MLELMYGEGFADDLRGLPDGANIRIYRVGNLAVLGTSTEDNAYVCDSACAQALISSDHRRYVETDSGNAYVSRGPFRADEMCALRYFATIDVYSDPDLAESTYIDCANCGSVLFRDDLAHLEAYGGLIVRTSEDWSGDDRAIWTGLVTADESGEMITPEIAHMIASQWHGGQSSALYSFTSTGRVFATTADDLRGEIDEELSGLLRDRDPERGKDVIALRALRAHIIGRFPSYFDSED